MERLITRIESTLDITEKIEADLDTILASFEKLKRWPTTIMNWLVTLPILSLLIGGK